MSYSQHDFYSDDPIEGSASPVKKKFPGFVAFLLLIFAGGSFLQTTLAANISINSGPVEFGQGIAQTTTCSGATNLTITPSSTLVNSSGGGAFYFSSVTVSNIPDSCYGKDFTIRAYGNTSNTPLALFNSSTTGAVVWNNDGTFRIGAGGSGATVSSGTGTFTVTFTAPVALASSVFKITLESGAHTDFLSVGAPGPSGGVTFLYSAAGFACGPTQNNICHNLEIAPADWFGPGGDPMLPWSVDEFDEVSVPAFNGFRPSNESSENRVGAGLSATLAIIAQNGPYSISNSYAAGAANAYRGGGHSDWHLPNFDEAIAFNSVYGQLIGQLGVHPTKEYWTSAECGTSGAYKIGRDGSNLFYLGGCNDKVSRDNPLRPIRAF
jgi:hypothetical protein